MPVIDAPYPKTDKEWQAHDDAQTLARAEVIKKDEVRLTRAQEAAAVIANREREEANAMQKVAGKKRISDDKPLRSRGGGSGSTRSTGSFNVFKKL